MYHYVKSGTFRNFGTTSKLFQTNTPDCKLGMEINVLENEKCPH